MNERKTYESKKLFIAVMLETTATGLLMSGFIDQNIWQNITMMVGGAYLITQAAVDRVRR